MTRAPWLCALLIGFAAPVSAAEQPPRPAPPASFQNLSQNQDQPVQIEATTLEVRDKSKMATFSGNVQVVQGDTTMKCQTLVVFYGSEAAATATAKPPPATAGQPAGNGPTPSSITQGAQNIRRIEARGGVTVVTKDQNASGDLGIYDLKSKTITLTGNVVVSQGKNVLHGERVVVDTATGNARVESGATAQNRVRALILPGKSTNGSAPNAPNAPNAMSIVPNRSN
jgi:lipopolysaccharide export system protein LptA